MLGLYDGSYIQEDLDRIRRTARDDADLLDAFLSQIDESDEAVWALSQRNGEHADPLFNVKAIDCFHQRGYNLYRIRPLKLLVRYRIVYAYDPRNDDFYVLAIVRKKLHDAPRALDPDCYNYEPDHPITARISDEYDDLDLPRLPGRR